MREDDHPSGAGPAPGRRVGPAAIALLTAAAFVVPTTLVFAQSVASAQSAPLEAIDRAIAASNVDQALAALSQEIDALQQAGDAAGAAAAALRRAETLSLAGRHAEALQSFADLAQSQPSSQDFLVKRGLAYLRAQQPQPAVATLETAAAADPSSALLRQRLGDAYYAKGDARRALSSYRQALRLVAPTMPPALMRGLGNAHYALREFRDAHRAYTAALSSNPADAVALLYRGWASLALGQSPAAFADIDKALALGLATPAALTVRGDLHRGAGRLGPAAADYQGALDLDRAYAPALYGLARVLVDQRRLSAAQPLLTELLSRARSDADLTAAALFLRGRANLLAGAHTEAAKDFTQYLAIRPDDADGHFNRALARDADGQIEPALEDLQKATLLRPDDPTLLYTFGRVAKAFGGGVAANRAFDRADALLDGATGDAALAARLARATAALHMGRADRAMGDLGMVLAERPADPDALKLKAQALMALGQRSDAIAMVEQFIAERPQDPTGHLLQGEALLAAGAFDRALESFETAARLGADRGRVGLLSGRAALAMADAAGDAPGSADRQTEALLKALQHFDAEVAARQNGAGALKRRAGVLMRLGRLEAAKSDLDQAIAARQRDASLIFARAGVLRRLGRCEEAIRDYDAGLALDSEHAGARAARAECKLEEGRIVGAVGDYLSSWF